MTPQQAVQLLNTRGINQPGIVKMLSERGIRANQPTISRIASGAIAEPKFALGHAIVVLAQEIDA